MFSSWVLEHITIGDTHRLRRGISTVGRHSLSTLRILDSNYVSRRHAEIEVSNDDQRVTIKDLKSFNGIYVNAEHHKAVTVSLAIGDRIGIGVPEAVGEQDEDVELTHPVFELKYLPISRARAAPVTPNLASSIAATQPKQPAGINIVKTGVKEPHSTSREASNAERPSTSGASAAKLETIGEVIIIDDDEDEDADSPKEKQPQKSYCSPQIQDEAPKANQITAPNQPKEQTTHVPDISDNQKQSVFMEIRSIFSNLNDEDFRKSLKEISPLVYYELIGQQPFLPATNDEIYIIDDDDDDEVNNYHKNCRETIKSPNILDSSLNDSKENKEDELIAATFKNNVSNAMDERLLTTSDNVDLDQYTTELQDEDDILFSQALLDDIKAELQDNNYDEVLNDEPCANEEYAERDLGLLTHVKPDFEKTSSILKDIENSCWVIDDNEDFDAELETKVSGWSNKIFSQSFSSMNMSQVYDLDPCNLTDDDDGEEDVKEINDEEKDDDCIYKVDLYNNDQNEKEVAENVEKDFQNFKEQLRKLNDDFVEDVVESVGQGMQEGSLTGTEKELKCARNYAKQQKESDLRAENGQNKQLLEPKSPADRSEKKKPDKINKCTDLTAKNMQLKLQQDIGKSDVHHKSEVSPVKDMCHNETETDSPLIRSKRKILTNVKCISSEEEDEDFVPNKQLSADPSKQKSNQKIIAKVPPLIIDAPYLPKNKGKLRGVSAEKPAHFIPTSKSTINEKENTTNERLTKDLKRKWVEKSSVSRKRDKDRDKKIKESRKYKLRQLAEKSKTSPKQTMKRRSNIGSDEGNHKKAKVKVTECNRGTFLAIPENNAVLKTGEELAIKGIEDSRIRNDPDVMAIKDPIKGCHIIDERMKKDSRKRTISNDSSFSRQTTMPDELLPKKVDFKAPVKVPCKKTESSKSKTNADVTTTQQPIRRSNNIDEGMPLESAFSLRATISQQIAMIDEILLKKAVRELKIPPSTKSKNPMASKEVIRKDAVASRALRTTNKITFASMEKNIIDTEVCNQKLSIISSIRNAGDRSKCRPKKSVRFNDVPTIHYIERICGASRKVVGKDILPQTTHRDRQIMVRRNYPIIDNTDKIISQILQWSNEWLVKCDAAADAVSTVVYPMPLHFTSFEHYKSTLFPLMKLEFSSFLERGYKATSHIKKYVVKLEHVIENKDRLMLVTKSFIENRKDLDNKRFDLVLLDSKQMIKCIFAYLAKTSRGNGSCNTMVFEVLAIDLNKTFFRDIKEFTVRPVIDNVRVEFGAYNAVYQLEATPLFHKILNPFELLQYRNVAKKTPIYRGCDKLNEEQTQVLLNTYSRIIDETTPNISLLQGPPGTGKSCVITNLALQTLYGDEVRYLDKKILICAQSNAAVDVIARKLFQISLRMRSEIRFRLIRYGVPEKLNPMVHPISLTHLVEHELLRKVNQANSNIQVENKESLRNQILLLESQINDLSGRSIKDTVEEDMLLEKKRQLQLLRSILNQLTRPEDERTLYSWYLNNANIVCATLSSCVKLSQFVNYFDICIIDEATQCTEPWTLLPLKFGINSLVLVGDTQQLPATVLSRRANELGLGKSMFTRIQNCLDNVPSGSSANNAKNAIASSTSIICGLKTQYRMHPEICRWPNSYFYRNELRNGRITMEYKTPLMPFSVLNLAYSQNEYSSDGKITNSLEAEFVAKLLKALDGLIPNKYNSYGVITPYAHHRTTLENSLRSLGLTNIMVNTIDSYQGLEKDVIVISNARTHGIGFLSNPQRLNVALTRPRKCLILCGNFKSLEVVPAWHCLMQSARERNVYFDISTNCVNDIQRNVIEKIKLKSLNNCNDSNIQC